MTDFLYTPLNTLKPLADDIWLVDGPEIRFGWGPFQAAFPTRMTVIRLPAGKLLIHSPIAHVPALAAELASLGAVTDIVAPNKIHYWWVGEWAAACPDARVLAAPGVADRAGDRMPAGAVPLDGRAVNGWTDVLSYLPVTGSFMTEAVFFHHPSRSLILTDLIENFEPDRISSVLKRLILRLAGILHPHGSMPRDMRLTFRGRTRHLRQAVGQMIDWHPHRIVLAHGKIYERDCRAELVRAFDFINVGP